MSGQPIIIHKAGDFYEVRGDQARVVSRWLQLTRQKRQGVDMVAVPYWRLEEFKGQLRELGYAPTEA